MNIPDIIIAVDGYSSTGKSTFARSVASSLGFLYLDSGALYRCVTLHAQENGIIDSSSAIDEPALKKSLESLDAHFENSGDGCRSYIGERCVEAEIRSLKVSNQVSPISAIPFVRAWVDERLRSFGSRGRVVMDGRDIGTTVFPSAQVKIFLTSAPEVRARRRFEEMVAKGQNPDIEDVRRNLAERDYLDSHRETSPLVRAADAYVLDNSDMTLKEELVWLRGLIQGKFGILE